MKEFDEKKFMEMLKQPTTLNSEIHLFEKVAKKGIEPKEKR
jgi:hypothetical protein